MKITLQIPQHNTKSEVARTILADFTRLCVKRIDDAEARRRSGLSLRADQQELGRANALRELINLIESIEIVEVP